VLNTYNSRRKSQGASARSWDQYVEDNSFETVLDKVVADAYAMPKSTKAAMSTELGVSRDCIWWGVCWGIASEQFSLDRQVLSVGG
jgi:hypothetical protein